MICRKFILILIVFLSTEVSGENNAENFGVDYIKLDHEPGIQLDIRYATKNNFTGKNLYGNYRSCYLHRDAAEKLKKALRLLHEREPHYKLLIFDCLRPRSIQKILYAHVRGTSQQPYVANPEGGSIHNFGFAVDLSILDGNGKEMDMGTAYDDFKDLARSDREILFLKKGLLAQEQLENRKLLRSIMTAAGFIQLPLEWWHYDALPAKEVRKRFSIVE